MISFDFLVHVGMPSCGSTWLQRNIFPNIPDIKLHTHSRIFNETALSIEEIHKFYRIPTQNKIKSANFIESDEALVGTSLVEAKRTAEKIKSCYPHARILIIFRNQQDLFSSRYRRWIRNGNSGSFEKFLKSPKGKEFLEKADYFKFVNMYFEIFGSDKVLALPFEILKHDGEEIFLSHIFKFADFSIPSTISKSSQGANVGLSHKDITLMNFTNKLKLNLPEYFIRNLSVLIPKALAENLIPTSQKEYIHETYSQSNKDLENLIQFDLKKFNYY